MLNNLKENPIGLTLAGLSAFFLLSLGLYAVGLGNWVLTAVLAWPGAFLYQSFSVLAVYIPVFLGVLALASVLPQLKLVLLTPLFASILPFLTSSLMVKIGTGAPDSGLTAWFKAQLGQTGSLLFLGLLTALEIAAVAVSAFLVFRQQESFTALAQDYKEEFSERENSAPFTAAGVNSKFTSTEMKNSAHPTREASAQLEEQPWEVFSVRSMGFGEPDVAFEPAVLRNDPFFEVPETEYRSQALDSLTQALRTISEQQKGPSVEQDYVEETTVVAGETLESQNLEPDVVDWDLLRGNFSYDEDELEEKALEPEIVPQPSQVIRPLEGGNASQPRTVFWPQPAAVKISTDPVATVTPAEDKPAELKTPTRRLRPGYHVPLQGLLTTYEEGNFSQIDETTQRSALILQNTLKEFSIDAQVTGIRKGPVVTMFEILPAAGVKLSKIVALADNIALGLAAISVRIVAPIPGKHAVGIEVPNRERTIVGFAEMIASPEFQESKAEIPIVLGKDISGETQIIDLARTPHLLIAGATGAGKSVCVNALVCSILFRRSPEDVRLLMVDPKIVELKFFNDIPHLLAPVITEPKKALQAIQWCLYEMERRYALLDAMGAKDIRSYNSKIDKRHMAAIKLPYIVVVIDEFADLMATSGKDMEGTIARLAAMSRAVGIHLVLATQRPSVDVITGLIKANFPSRVAFMVASKTDSRIIIDQMGAEKLLGRGDMLFTSSWNPFPSRLQGAFLSEEDVERVVAHVKTLGEPEYISDEIFYDEEEEEAASEEISAGEMDPLFEKAVEVVRTFKKASASFLQRRLGVGYNRAARMVEQMEEMGIVGPQNGSKPREIVHAG
ncbi:MAG: DNA translocase FtsK [Spirochaetales bacterium]|nr:DNA translocase FtsK [Spirochaetales bacterium]